ncbi:MAG: acylphosphatase [Ruminococcus sp.]|nr:acylphosphatase [Ruminococcus sp.]
MEKLHQVRKYIRFYGWVQGVGFRYVARMAAERSGATGWVRNEFDGSVSMEIQGTERDIDSVLQALGSGGYIRIEHIETRDIPVLADERGFRVRY